MSSYFSIKYLILRALQLFYALIMFLPLYLTSFAWEGRPNSMYEMLPPILISIGLIVALVKVRKGVYVAFIAIAFYATALSMYPQGSFMHTTLMGSALFSIFFNAIRPYDV